MAEPVTAICTVCGLRVVAEEYRIDRDGGAMKIEPDAVTVSEWQTKIRRAGMKLIDEMGGVWVDIPADIAEGAVVQMLIMLVDFGYDLEDFSAANIGRLLGVIDTEGKWL